jgi:hypothetical protein
MHFRNLKLAVWLAFAVGAYGQPPAATQSQSQHKAAYDGQPLDGGADAVRLFFFTHAEGPEQIQEFVNLIRTATEIQRISPAQGTVSLRGSPTQIALAEWLFSELDKPSDAASGKPATYDFPGPNGAIDAVRLLYFAHDAAPANPQEMINLIRTITDIRRASSYSARRVLLLRGSPEQMALAEWLFGELDKVADPQTRRIDKYPETGPLGRADAVRLFFYANNETPQDFQEILQMIRTTTDLQRTFSYTPRRTIALRGTPSQIALAEWLFRESGPSGRPK